MHVVLMTKEARHVKRRVADEICHDTVITDMDGAFASHVAQGVNIEVCPPALPTTAPTSPEVRQESARDKTVLTNIRKALSAHDKFQRDAKSVIAKSVELDLKIALVRGKSSIKSSCRWERWH